MLLYSDESLVDLAAIKRSHGSSAMLMLLQSCEELAEPSARIEAVRLGGDTEIFRLRVGDFHILFELQESRTADRIRILRVRPRR